MLTQKKKSQLLRFVFLANILLIPLYVVRFSLFEIPTNISELAMISAIVFWLLLSDKKFFISTLYSNKALFFAIILLLLGTIASLYGSNFNLASLGILKGWFLIPIVFSMAMLSVTDSEENIDSIILFVFLSTFFVSLIALVYKTLGIITFDGRLQAFYGSPNYLAMYISPGILCGFYLAYKFKGFSNKKLPLVFLMSFIEIMVLFWTQSYTNWLALVLALFVILLIYPDIKKRFIIILFSGFLCIFILLSQLNSPKLSTLLANDSRSSLSSRIMIWRASVLMIEKNPLLGIGAGNFQKEYLLLQPHFPPYLEWAVPQPHNIFLAFWLQSGLFGLFSFLAIVFIVISSLLKKLYRKNKNAPREAFLLAFFFYIVIAGLFDTPYWKNDLALLFWVFIILTISTINNFSEKKTLI